MSDIEKEVMKYLDGWQLVVTNVPARPNDWYTGDGWHYSFIITAPNGHNYSGHYSQGTAIVASKLEAMKRHTKYHYYSSRNHESASIKQIIKHLRGSGHKFLYVSDAIEANKAKLADMAKPSMVDIFMSILMDGCGSDQDFPEWAADLGYSDDSIRAKAIWEECNKARRFIQACFSAKQMEQLYELQSEW